MNAALRFLRAARQCEIRGLEQLAATCGLVGEIGAFVHAMQRERGLSNLYLASSEARFGDPLDRAVTASLAHEQGLRSGFEELDTDTRRTASGVRLFSRIADVLHRLDGLPGLRMRIRARRIDAGEAEETLTRLIGGVLTVVFEAADTATDPGLSRALAAMFNFMQGKELAGQERAVGVAGFALGRFDAARQQRLGNLIDAQERCFELFAEFAEAEVLLQWCNAVPVHDIDAFAHLRRLAAGSPSTVGVDARTGERWFDLATLRIDAMRSIEETMTHRLAGLCGHRMAEAEAVLSGHSAPPESLPCPPTTGGLSEPGFGVDTGLAAAATGGALERSVLAMVQEQAQRLQQMGDELEAVRAALKERKFIERAKGLLMAHRGLSEDQAYRLMRQTAMDQGRRLADVAESVLALGPLLDGQAGTTRRSFSAGKPGD